MSMKTARTRRPAELSVGRGRALAGACVMSIGLAACAALNPVYTDSGGGPGPNYDRNRMVSVVNAGPMPLEVLGNPSDLSATDFELLTAQRTRLAPIWGPHRFTVDSATTPSHGYRVVMAFNPKLDPANTPAEQKDAAPDSTERHGIQLCNGQMETHTDGPYPALPIKKLERFRARPDQVWPKYLAERLLVRGALCLGDVPITTGFVERNALEDYDDPEFDQVLLLLLLRLMPYRDASQG